MLPLRTLTRAHWSLEDLHNMQHLITQSCRYSTIVDIIHAAACKPTCTCTFHKHLILTSSDLSSAAVLSVEGSLEGVFWSMELVMWPWGHIHMAKEVEKETQIRNKLFPNKAHLVTPDTPS